LYYNDWNLLLTFIFHSRKPFKENKPMAGVQAANRSEPGASAPFTVLQEQFGFTTDNVYEKAKALLG
jgi:transketolase